MRRIDKIALLIKQKIRKTNILDNLFTKPNGVTKIKNDNLGRPSYNRVEKWATTSINPNNNNVISCRKVSRQDRRDFNLVNVSKNKRRKKYVRQNPKNQIIRKSERRSKKILERLKINKLTDDTICDLQEELDFLISSLVNAKEEGETIDEELLEIYDLIQDVVLDNEEDLDFLNQLFFN